MKFTSLIFGLHFLHTAIGRVASPLVRNPKGENYLEKVDSGPTNVTHQLSLSPNIVHEMPKGTWLENLAIRQTDGNALVTDLSAPDIYFFSTTTQFEPIKIASLPEATGCLGIAELSLDVFYVIAGNWSNTTVTSTPGSYSIWQVDMQSWSWDSEGHENPTVSKVVDLPDSGFLNGMDVLNPVSGVLLVGDSSNGVVWSVNVRTGQISVAINDTSMAPIPKSDGGFDLGINGVQIRDNYLYYSNSDHATLHRIPIDVRVGFATGPAEQLANFSGMGLFPDDFAIDFFGNIWMTLDVGSGLALLRNATATSFVEKNTTLEVVANSTQNPRIQGWTSARFGKKRDDVAQQSIYVTTNGGAANYANESWVGGGMLVKLDTEDIFP